MSDINECLRRALIFPSCGPNLSWRRDPLLKAFCGTCCSEVSGNANLVAHRILEKLPQNDRCAAAVTEEGGQGLCLCFPDHIPLFLYCPEVDLSPRSTLSYSRVSYSQERHLFHIVVRDGITFLCMADEVRFPHGIFAVLFHRTFRILIHLGSALTMLDNLLPGIWAAHPICILGGCAGQVPIPDLMHTAARCFQTIISCCLLHLVFDKSTHKNVRMTSQNAQSHPCMQ